jgi:hypothetical protein
MGSHNIDGSYCLSIGCQIWRHNTSTRLSRMNKKTRLHCSHIEAKRSFSYFWYFDFTVFFLFFFFFLWKDRKNQYTNTCQEKKYKCIVNPFRLVDKKNVICLFKVVNANTILPRWITLWVGSLFWVSRGLHFTPTLKYKQLKLFTILINK